MSGWIWVIMGPAGSGKSAIGEVLAAKCGFPFLEGDDFHTPENKALMGQGTPLDDKGRWAWLDLLRSESLKQLGFPANKASNEANATKGVVLSCSALKSAYRVDLRRANSEEHQIFVRFLFLKVSESTLAARVKARVGHYMKAEMVKSQMETLEEPTDGESDCFIVDAEHAVPEVAENAYKIIQAEQKF